MSEPQPEYESAGELAERNPPTQVLDIISRAARDPDIDIDKFERLMGMQERILERDAEAAYNRAMNEAQAEMRRISADARNPQTHSEYASYGALDKALRPIYTRHGFSLSFDTEPSDKAEVLVIACRVSHTAGHSRTHRAPMPADGKGAKGGDVMTKTHAAGSAMSYGMRYLLKMIFNVAIGDDDDDGNAADAPPVFIADDQVAKLAKLIKDTDSDLDKFLEYAHVEKLEDIEVRNYETLLLRLKEKAAKQAQAE